MLNRYQTTLALSVLSYFSIYTSNFEQLKKDILNLNVAEVKHYIEKNILTVTEKHELKTLLKVHLQKSSGQQADVFTRKNLLGRIGMVLSAPYAYFYYEHFKGAQSLDKFPNVLNSHTNYYRVMTILLAGAFAGSTAYFAYCYRQVLKLRATQNDYKNIQKLISEI